MGHIGVPWFIGGGADHSAEVARLLAYNATGGREGVIGQTDCRVLALATPGAAIRAMPGAYNIKLHTKPYAMYLGMIDSEDVVNTTPTSSSGSRSDLVCFRVENPNISGESWDYPDDIENGPYVRTVIIEGVPSTTKSFADLGLMDSAIAVARIDIPPSTATITQTMIKDLRAGATASGGTAGDAPPATDPPSTPPAAASQTFTAILQSPSITSFDDIKYTQSTFKNWPTVVNITIPVPDWATIADFEVVVMNATQMRSDSGQVGNVWGESRINLGGVTSSPIVYNSDYVYGTGGTQACIVATGGTISIPSTLRGKNQNLKMETRSYGSLDSETRGTMRFYKGAYAKVWMHFKSTPQLVAS